MFIGFAGAAVDARFSMRPPPSSNLGLVGSRIFAAAFLCSSVSAGGRRAMLRTARASSVPSKKVRPAMMPPKPRPSLSFAKISSLLRLAFTSSSEAEASVAESEARIVALEAMVANLESKKVRILPRNPTDPTLESHTYPSNPLTCHLGWTGHDP